MTSEQIADALHAKLQSLSDDDLIGLRDEATTEIRRRESVHVRGAEAMQVALGKRKRTRSDKGSKRVKNNVTPIRADGDGAA